MKLSLQPLMYRISTSMLRPFAFTCLVAAASMGWTGWAAAAACFSNSIFGTDTIIMEQAALDALDALEASGCDSVLGNLEVQANYTITNLDGLANITSVGGDLVVSNSYVLTNLDGLANITSVGGGLYIRDNYAITNLDGLANITTVEWLSTHLREPSPHQP